MNNSRDHDHPLNYHVPSVESACLIIKHVCKNKEPASLAELTKVSETSRTTALRIVTSLCNHGFLKRREDGSYTIGETLNYISGQIGYRTDVRRRAVTILQQIANITKETAHFVVPMEAHCLILEVADSPQLVRVASRPGSLIDYHSSATGKVILAHSDELRLKLSRTLTLSKHTPNTFTNWEKLDQELERIRKHGYAVDEQEYHEGIRCVAVPIHETNGIVTGAIGITGSSTSVTKKRVPTIAKQLQAASSKL